MASKKIGKFTLVSSSGMFGTYRFNYDVNWDKAIYGKLCRHFYNGSTSGIAEFVEENANVGIFAYGALSSWFQPNSTIRFYVQNVNSYPSSPDYRVDKIVGYFDDYTGSSRSFLVYSDSNMLSFGTSSLIASRDIWAVVNDITFNNGGNIQSVYQNTYPSKNLATFPAKVQNTDRNMEFTVYGNPIPNVTVQNGQNMKQIQVGSTVYSNLPITISIPTNTTIIASGEDDKIITLETSNTNPPIITNT